MNMATPIFRAFIDMINMQGIKCDLEKGTGAYCNILPQELEETLEVNSRSRGLFLSLHRFQEIHNSDSRLIEVW